MKIRVDKLLSDLGLATRSELKKKIRSGQLTVNGVRISDPGLKCDPDQDDIFFDGKKITYQFYQYFMLNKPAGCITATEDSKEKTVMDFLPAVHHKNMSPVGRLDKDTEGLLLITDDGALNHALLSPSHHVEKTYFVEVDRELTDDLIDIFLHGVDIGEKKLTAPATLQILDQTECFLTITEGKFHQVKRMFQAQGFTVTYLKRVQMGPLKLDDTLEPGMCRLLTDAEIAELKKEGAK